MTEYRDYRLTHWEEPDISQRIVAKDGVISVTPEFLYEMLQSYLPVAHREGQVSIDVTVKAFEEFWMELGGKVER